MNGGPVVGLFWGLDDATGPIAARIYAWSIHEPRRTGNTAFCRCLALASLFKQRHNIITVLSASFVERR